MLFHISVLILCILCSDYQTALLYGERNLTPPLNDYCHLIDINRKTSKFFNLLMTLILFAVQLFLGSTDRTSSNS